MGQNERLEDIVKKHLTSPDLFLVDIEIKGGKGLAKVIISIDGDNGINIDQCALISRKVSEELEAENFFDGAYILEVSSPGLDQPLKFVRQYQKNIGRKISVTLTDSKILKGRLESADEEKILLITEKKEKSKIISNEIEIPYKEIKKTNILVSFN